MTYLFNTGILLITPITIALKQKVKTDRRGIATTGEKATVVKSIIPKIMLKKSCTKYMPNVSLDRYWGNREPSVLVP